MLWFFLPVFDDLHFSGTFSGFSHGHLLVPFLVQCQFLNWRCGTSLRCKYIASEISCLLEGSLGHLLLVRVSVNQHLYWYLGEGRMSAQQCILIASSVQKSCLLLFFPGLPPITWPKMWLVITRHILVHYYANMPLIMSPYLISILFYFCDEFSNSHHS